MTDARSTVAAADALEAARRIRRATDNLHRATGFRDVERAWATLRRLGFWSPKVATAIAALLEESAVVADIAPVPDVFTEAVEAILARQPDRRARR